MERKASSNLRNKIAKLLSLLHTTSIATILVSPPPSPRKPTSTKRFYTSMIPSEARRKPRNRSSSFDTREPASPKVSCLGQIANRKKPKPKPKPNEISFDKGAKENLDDYPKEKANGSNGGIEVVPSLGEMKRFTSGRGVVSEFQWNSQVRVVSSRSKEEDHTKYVK